MTMTSLAPDHTDTEHDDGLTHFWCHDPNTAHCSTDLSDTPEVPDTVPVDCVVCIDVARHPCPICEV